MTCHYRMGIILPQNIVVTLCIWGKIELGEFYLVLHVLLTPEFADCLIEDTLQFHEKMIYYANFAMSHVAY